MKDYKKLQEICLREIEAVGIKPGPIVGWEINKRAKSRFGLCTKKPNGECIIQIAERLLTDDNISEQMAKETICHEILHTCPECKGHTGYWRQYAEVLNQTYGYHIKRTTSYTEMGVEELAVKSMAPKYVFVCKKCGQQIVRKRDSKFTRHYRLYSCGICGTHRAFVKYVL